MGIKDNDTVKYEEEPSPSKPKRVRKSKAKQAEIIEQ